MIRIEAMNHDGGYDLLGVFDFKDHAKAFAKANDNYFLRIFECFNGKRKLIHQNF